MMHYLFLDESYSTVSETRTIVVASWSVGQERFNHQHRVGNLSKLFLPPIIEMIDSILKSLDALAIVAVATLDRSLFKAGETDDTDDIPAMARTDNVWSQSVIFAVGSVVKALLHKGDVIDTVDVYFDPKSLKVPHKTALEKVLRETMVREARNYVSARGVRRFEKLRIRRVQSVCKPGLDEIPSKFQMGTWISDKLCSYSGHIIEPGGTSRIQVQDMSDVVRRTVQQFDGKSFHD